MQLFYCLFVSIVLSLPVIGQNAATKSNPDDKSTSEVFPNKIETSQSNRVGKTATLMLEAGFGITFPATGVGAGYFLSSDSLIEISQISGESGFIDVNLEYSVIGLGYKKFFGNSFYFHGGLAQRTFDFSIITIFGEPQLSAEATSTSLGLDLGIGNRWQWDGFTLGCTWVGYFLPLSESNSFTDFGNASQGEIDDLNKALSDFGEVGHFQLLRLVLGWSF